MRGWGGDRLRPPCLASSSPPTSSSSPLSPYPDRPKPGRPKRPRRQQQLGPHADRGDERKRAEAGGGVQGQARGDGGVAGHCVSGGRGEGRARNGERGVNFSRFNVGPQLAPALSSPPSNAHCALPPRPLGRARACHALDARPPRTKSTLTPRPPDAAGPSASPFPRQCTAPARPLAPPCEPAAC